MSGHPHDEARKSPPSEGAWQFDGWDLMRKEVGVWRAMLSTLDPTWHALTAEDCRLIVASLAREEAERERAERAEADLMTLRVMVGGWVDTEYDEIPPSAQALIDLARCCGEFPECSHVLAWVEQHDAALSAREPGKETEA